MNLQELITAVSLLLSSVSGLIATLRGQQVKRQQKVLQAVADQYDLRPLLEAMLADGRIDEREFKLLQTLLSYGKDDTQES